MKIFRIISPLRENQSLPNICLHTSFPILFKLYKYTHQRTMRRQMIYVCGIHTAGIRCKVIWNSSQFCKDPSTLMSCLSLCSFSVPFICKFPKVYCVLFPISWPLWVFQWSLLQDLNELSHVYVSLNEAKLRKEHRLWSQINLRFRPI